MPRELVLILDYGSQYTQLIARRVRELVANACATTTAALGIEKVHEPNAEAQTRQQCTVIAEHGQLLQVFR